MTSVPRSRGASPVYRLLVALLLATTFSSAFARGRSIWFLAAATTALLSATALLVNPGPSAATRFLLACSPLLVTARNLFRLAFLLRCIFLLTSACHCFLTPPFRRIADRNA